MGRAAEVWALGAARQTLYRLRGEESQRGQTWLEGGEEGPAAPASPELGPCSQVVLGGSTPSPLRAVRHRLGIAGGAGGFPSPPAQNTPEGLLPARQRGAGKRRHDRDTPAARGWSLPARGCCAMGWRRRWRRAGSRWRGGSGLVGAHPWFWLSSLPGAGLVGSSVEAAGGSRSHPELRGKCASPVTGASELCWWRFSAGRPRAGKGPSASREGLSAPGSRPGAVGPCGTTPARRRLARSLLGGYTEPFPPRACQFITSAQR